MDKFSLSVDARNKKKSPVAPNLQYFTQVTIYIKHKFNSLKIGNLLKNILRTLLNKLFVKIRSYFKTRTHLLRPTTSRGEIVSPCDENWEYALSLALGGAEDGRRLVESGGRARGEKERAHLSRWVSERDGYLRPLRRGYRARRSGGSSFRERNHNVEMPIATVPSFIATSSLILRLENNYDDTFVFHKGSFFAFNCKITQYILRYFLSFMFLLNWTKWTKVVQN